MISKITSLLKGDRLTTRTIRSTLLTFGGFGANMVLRFGSNLLLTRLLMPEAFGLMALVQLVVVGLQMFSDVGLNDAIIRSKRGSDPVFLNTAWVVTILRGLVLWVIVLAVSGPFAQFYDDPRLAEILPIAALSLIFGGFVTTRTALAYRNLQIGRLTALELFSQFFGILVMAVLAWQTGSIWALVIGGLVSEFCRASLSHLVITGPRNRIEWENAAFGELFSFGKFVFVTSILGFVVNNSDRAILGKFVSLSDLAVYNIGFMLAAVPIMLTRRVNDSVLMSLYSQVYRDNQSSIKEKLVRGRFLLTSSLVVANLLLGLIGNWLIVSLYTEPYHLAGAVLVLLCAANGPLISLMYYKAVYLGSGNPQYFMYQFLALSILQVCLLYFSISLYGLLGAIVSPGLAMLLIYPITAWLAHRCGGWDPLRDGIFLLASTGFAGGLVWLHGPTLTALLP